MPYRRSTASPVQTAVSPGGGCLSGFLVPPLAVLLVCGLLVFLLFGLNGGNGPAGAPVLSDMRNSPPAGISGPAPAPLFTPEVQYWAGSIRSWAAEADLDPNLVATVMQIESCGNPSAHSSAGAIGLFQVMPYHFYFVDNPYNPSVNAERGLAYLKRALDASGQVPRLALAGYNGGISVIGRGESTWAAETQRYVYWGSGIYMDAVKGLSESQRLQEWLAAGGASLCRTAGQVLGITPFFSSTSIRTP